MSRRTILWAVMALAPLARAEPAAGSHENEVQADQHLRHGVALHQAGAVDDALEEYRAANALFPCPDCLFLSAEIHRLKGNPGRAAELYQQYLDAEPKGTAAEAARAYVAAHPVPPPPKPVAVAPAPPPETPKPTPPPAVAAPPPVATVAPPVAPAAAAPAPPPPGWMLVSVKETRRREFITAGTALFVVGAILTVGAGVMVYLDNYYYSRFQGEATDPARRCLIPSTEGPLNTCEGGTQIANGSWLNVPKLSDEISMGRAFQTAAIAGFAIGGAMDALGLGLLFGSLAFRPDARDAPGAEKKAGIKLRPLFSLGRVGLTGEF